MIIRQNQVTTLPPSPPPRPAAQAETPEVRDWAFVVVHVAGHGIAGDIADNLRTIEKGGASKAAYITVRAEQADQVTDYTAGLGGGLKPMPGGFYQVSSQTTPVTDQKALSDFLVQAVRQYPARHYYISFDGHSRQLRQVIPQLHAGLEAVKRATGDKVDVLSFDSCFMGQIETASEFKDVAHTLVASQDFIRGSSPVSELAQQMAQHPMDRHQVAQAVVAERVGKECTASAMDLDRTEEVNGALAGLARQIEAVADPKTLALVRKDIRHSQHFYTLGVLEPSPYHATVDVADAMERLAADRRLAQQAPALVEQARQVKTAVQESGFLLGEQHTPQVQRLITLDLRDDRHAHGVSMNFPTTAPSPMRSHYTHFQDSQFERETHWDEAMSHLTQGSGAYQLESHIQDMRGAALWGLSLFLDDVQEHWTQLRHPARLFEAGQGS